MRRNGERGDYTYVTVNGREYSLEPTRERCNHCGERGLFVDQEDDRVSMDGDFTFCPACCHYALTGRADFNNDISISLP